MQIVIQRHSTQSLTWLSFSTLSSVAANNSQPPPAGLEVKWHWGMDDCSTYYWGRMSIKHARRCAPDMKVLGKVLTDLCQTFGLGRHWPGLYSLPLLRRQCREEFSANLSHSGARCLFVLEGPSHLHWALPDALGTLHYHMGNPTIPHHMDRH